ncbi:MAG: nucleoside deaminase [Clostridia bacterium]|nr:nucleoside deaminase [Clostridia bacterium]
MEPMDLALAEAEKALAEGEVPVGAVLVRNGEVICAAHNTREKTKDPTAHAEMLCLREGARVKGDWRLDDCTLYVTLEPCPMCAGAIVMSRLGKVVFGAADPEKGCCGSVYLLPSDPALHGKTSWRPLCEEARCREVLTRFFETKRNRER